MSNVVSLPVRRSRKSIDLVERNARSVSPYLDQPLRSFEQALADSKMLRARWIAAAAAFGARSATALTLP